MTNLTEDDIEQNLIDLLKSEGYGYFHGTELDGVRGGLDQVVIEGVNLKHPCKGLILIWMKLLWLMLIAKCWI